MSVLHHALPISRPVCGRCKDQLRRCHWEVRLFPWGIAGSAASFVATEKSWGEGVLEALKAPFAGCVCSLSSARCGPLRWMQSSGDKSCLHKVVLLFFFKALSLISNKTHFCDSRTCPSACNSSPHKKEGRGRWHRARKCSLGHSGPTGTFAGEAVLSERGPSPVSGDSSCWPSQWLVMLLLLCCILSTCSHLNKSLASWRSAWAT